MNRLRAALPLLFALVLAPLPARGDEAQDPAAAPKPAETAAPEKAAPAKADPGPVTATPPADAPKAPTDLIGAMEELLGTTIDGRLTTRYVGRRADPRDGGDDEKDHDLYQYLDVRVGEEWRDEFSAVFSLRTSADLDGRDRSEQSSFTSLADSYDKSVNVRLYTAYLNWRPKTGKWVESVRFGRQQVVAAETYQLDGLSVESRVLEESIDLRVRVYGGVPSHIYESSPSGDWIAGIQVSAEPIEGTRAALDYTHVKDQLEYYGHQRSDLAAFSAWQDFLENYQVYGRLTWLEELRDFTVRGTAAFPDEDLLVQVSYFQLMESKEELATEFDPFFEVLRTLDAFHQAEIRAAKGFGDNWYVEAGGSVRKLLHDQDESVFNRDMERVYVTPSYSGFPWKGSTVSVTGEILTGSGERLKTGGAEFEHVFSKELRLAIGSDYSLYRFGPMDVEERDHVRTVYMRVRAAVTETVSMEFRYAWEKDDEERFDVLTLGVSLDF